MRVTILHRFLYFVSLIMLSTLLQGCTHNKITSSWADQSFPGPVTGSILVIGAFTDPTAHKIYEDGFVEALTKAGVKAVPSYTFNVRAERHSKKWFQLLRKESGANFILITHLSNETAKNVDYAAEGVVWGGAMVSDDTDGVETYHAYVAEDTTIPEETVTTTTDYLVATLFDSRTGKPIWSAHSKDVDLNDYLRKDDEKVENLFIQDMKTHHIL